MSEQNWKMCKTVHIVKSVYMHEDRPSSWSSSIKAHLYLYLFPFLVLSPCSTASELSSSFLSLSECWHGSLSLFAFTCQCIVRWESQQSGTWNGTAGTHVFFPAAMMVKSGLVGFRKRHCSMPFILHLILLPRIHSSLLPPQTPPI